MSISVAAGTGLGGAAAPSPGVEVADISASAAPAPSASDAAQFAQEVSHVQEVQAPRASAAQSIGQDLTHRLQGLSEHLQGWQKPAPMEHAHAAAGGHAGSSGAAGTGSGDAVSQLQGVYAFAIETTLASRGSTESTKIFNTLLKGQ